MKHYCAGGSVRAYSIAILIAVMSLTLFGVLLVTYTNNDINYFSKLILFVRYVKDTDTAVPHSDSVKPICSLQFLKQYATEHHSYSSFPFEQIGTVRTISPPGDYSCWFPDPDIRQNLTTHRDECTNLSHIYRMLVLGDSNERRYTDAIINWLKESR